MGVVNGRSQFINGATHDLRTIHPVSTPRGCGKPDKGRTKMGRARTEACYPESFFRIDSFHVVCGTKLQNKNRFRKREDKKTAPGVPGADDNNDYRQGGKIVHGDKRRK